MNQKVNGLSTVYNDLGRRCVDRESRAHNYDVLIELLQLPAILMTKYDSATQKVTNCSQKFLKRRRFCVRAGRGCCCWHKNTQKIYKISHEFLSDTSSQLVDKKFRCFCYCACLLRKSFRMMLSDSKCIKRSLKLFSPNRM